MVIRQTQALFTKRPRVLGEIVILDAIENLRPIKIEKTIILPQVDFRNFTTDMTVERQFLRKHSSLCKIDDKGICHCLLVVLRGRQDGILVMADKEGYPIYAARFWKKADSHALFKYHSSTLYSCH